ncbi:MAG: 4'-phosphopantetheinyl transferase superfamily protein [Bdellovibrionota bacterium]|nr:MAG: 4'-phosphopantetheinyl transferase superfamily protein [Bdellovibrionota bacterium]
MQLQTLGNDIVDLKAIEPPLHPGYKERVCTRREGVVVGKDPAMLWLHWAAKEAAYKALKRIDPRVQFIPRDLEFDALLNVVRWRDIEFPCRVERDAECIVVTCAPFHCHLCSWWQECHPESEAQASELVRRLLRDKLITLYGIPSAEIEIESVAGVPWIRLGRSRSRIPVSFSHHGRFVACAVLDNLVPPIDIKSLNPASCTTP